MHTEFGETVRTTAKPKRKVASVIVEVAVVSLAFVLKALSIAFLKITSCSPKL
jgi:hypothetical protein